MANRTIPATATAKERKQMPASAFLDPSGRRYPFKRERNGQWEISCKDLRDAISVANSQNDAAISRKASRLLKQHCGGGR